MPAPRLPRLHSRLLLLAGLTLLPVLVLSVILAALVITREEAALRDAVLARNRTLVSAIDAQMGAQMAALRVLASAESLEVGDLPRFRNRAARALASQPDWRNVLLVDADGQQLVNARLPKDTPLPHEFPPQIDEVRETLRLGGAARILPMGRGPVSGVMGVPVQQVVSVNGRSMVLEAIVLPSSLARVMLLQHYPQSWALGLVDGKGRFIARQPERPVGDLASPGLREQMTQASEGWYRGRTLEGKDSYSGYVRSRLTGWTVAAAIPAEEVMAPAWQAAGLIAAGAALSLALALAFAWWLAGHVGRPIADLARNARLLAEGAAPGPWPGALEARVDEVRQLALALERASAAVAERETLMKREQGALMAADKAKDEFLAMLGHELRNPLSAITASAHVLRLSAPDGPAATMAHQVIERQARQMTRLVEDLLDISRLAMHKVTLQPERLELGATVERMVHTWQQAARSRGARLSIVRGVAWVDADRARLEQIVDNLLDNAEKFSREAGGPIEVAVRADGDDAVVEVTDQGQGIAAGDLSRIFEPFVQGPQTFDRPQGGIGLGLALVQRLVALHGGRVLAHSAGAGRGARFEVRLPRREGPASDAAEPAVHARGQVGRRILLVEDNDDARQVMEALLSLEGHAVRTAPDARTALAMAPGFQPEIMILDIGLPDMDGHELARRLRALPWPHPPRLVALSGFGQPEDQRRAYEAGFDLHLTKPVSPEFLREVLSALATRTPAAG